MAAAEVVGEVGFADASIAMITQRAGVAQGTFYNYFKTRQELFDQLVPEFGQRMLRFVREKSEGAHGYEELEERAFYSLFAFLRENPFYYRLHNEAESFAPSGYQQYFRDVYDFYKVFLQRSLKDGLFPAYKEDEIEVVARVLIAVRSYLIASFAESSANQDGALPDDAIGTVMKFILYGLEGVAPAKKAKPKAPDSETSGARARARPSAGVAAANKSVKKTAATATKQTRKQGE